MAEISANSAHPTNAQIHAWRPLQDILTLGGWMNQVLARTVNGGADLYASFYDIYVDATEFALAPNFPTERLTYLPFFTRPRPLLEIGDFLSKLADGLEKKAERKRDKLHIPGSLLVIWNPTAHNGATYRIMSRLSSDLRKMQESGELKIDGDVQIESTDIDPDTRVKKIASTIGDLLEKRPGQRVAVVALGGDRTASDVAKAARQVLADHAADASKPNIVVVAGPGGTANDLRRIMGVPSDAKGLINFLGSAVVTNVRGVNLELLAEDGKTRNEFTVHGTSWGKSGDANLVFEEKKRREGSVSVLDGVLLLLLYGFLNFDSIHVKLDVNGEPLNKGEAIPTLDVGAMVTQGFGMIMRYPMPEQGAKIMLLPPNPWGSVVFIETFVRGLLALLGFQHVIKHGSRLLTLPRGRDIDILPGDVATMRFEDKEGKPVSVRGTISGDQAGPVTGMIIGVEEPVGFLTSQDADIRVQQGLAYPSFPGDGITDGISHVINMGQQLMMMTSAFQMMNQMLHPPIPVVW